MYSVYYFPQGSTVYLHTSLFGKNQLIAGKVICTFLMMKKSHPSTLFISTNFGIVKYQDGRCIDRLNMSLDFGGSGERCDIYNSIDDFHAGKIANRMKADAPIDVYGLKNNDNSSTSCGDFTVWAYYISGTNIEDAHAPLYYLLYDESNNRLVPAHGLDKTDALSLSTPMSKQEVLDKISSRYRNMSKIFESYALAQASMKESVEIIGLDGSLVLEIHKQPTIKDKLLEFVNQQGTSLDMLKTIIDEMP